MPKTDPEEMSGVELNEYLDEMADDPKRNDSPEFHRAYAIWEKTQ